MASTLSRRLNKKVRWLAALVLFNLYFPIPGTLSAQTFRQHFSCSTGYTAPECQAATAVLRRAVALYPLGELGEWTWILVRPVDWKRNLATVGINPNDPGFSNLTKRKTFLDGSLVEKVSIRGIELRTVWHMPIEELLDLTIRHELAHALCNERDEWKAERIALTLKNGAPSSCPAIRVAKTKDQANDVSTSNARGFGRQDSSGGSIPDGHWHHPGTGASPRASVSPTGNRPSSKRIE